MEKIKQEIIEKPKEKSQNGVSIRLKIAAITIGFLIAAMLVVNLANVHIAKTITTSLYENMIGTISEQVSLNIDKFFEKYQILIDSVSTSEELKNYLINGESLDNFNQAHKPVYDYFERVQGSYPELSKNAMFFGSDKYKRYMHYESDTDATQRPWYIDAVSANADVWSAPYEDKATGETVMTISTPVFSGNRLLGVLATDIFLTQINEYVQGIKISETGAVSLLETETGRIIAHNNAKLVGTTIDPKLLDFIKTSDKNYTYFSMADGEKLIFFKNLDRTGLTVISYVEKAEVVSASNKIIQRNILIAIVAIIISSIVILYVVNKIVNRIVNVSKGLDEAAKGDLSQRIIDDINDEIGSLVNSYNTMACDVSNLIISAENSGEVVLRSSENLAAISEEVTANSQNVLASLEEISSGVEQQSIDAQKGMHISNAFSENFDILMSSSMELNKGMENAANVSKKGVEYIDNLREKYDIVNNANKRVENAIVRLDESNQQVAGIIETINAISNQTSLLALNASIEAARAGEAGKGFAVVAEEIRKLAEETESATKKIENILGSIKEESSESVNVISEVRESYDEQEIAIKEVESTFNNILSSINEWEETMNRIIYMVNNLKGMKDDLNNSIKGISEISKVTASSTEDITLSMEDQSKAIEQVANLASSLSAQITNLQDIVKKFTV